MSDTKKYFDVEIPEEFKEFFQKFGAVVKRDEDELYTAWPSGIDSKALGCVPVCKNGAFYISSQETLTHLKLVCVAVYNVANLLETNRAIAGQL